MQYMCLIYSTDGTGPQPGTPEFGPFLKSYMDFTQTVKADGKFVAGDALQSVSTATTVSVPAPTGVAMRHSAGVKICL